MNEGGLGPREKNVITTVLSFTVALFCVCVCVCMCVSVFVTNVVYAFVCASVGVSASAHVCDHFLFSHSVL